MDLKNIQHPTPNIEHPMGQNYRQAVAAGEGGK